MQFPHESFHKSLIREIANSGQTIAGLGRTLSKENDKLPRTNERMIRRLRDRLNPQVMELITLLDALGLELTIVPRRVGGVVDGDRKSNE
jgi:DNA-binding phage protein